MKNKIICSTLLALTITACSSTTKSVVDLSHIGETEVLQEHGDNDLKDALPYEADGNLVTATSMISIPGENRLESGIKMAQMQAKSTLAHTIESSLNSFSQYSAETSSADSVQMRELIGDTAKVVANEFKLGKVYYEKQKIISDSGIPVTKWKIWAQVYTDEANYKKLVMDAIRKRQGRGQFTAEFAKVVDKNFSQMVEGEDAEKEPTRKAASTEESSKDEE